MLELSILTGRRHVPLFDLPVRLGRAGAAREIGDTIDGLIAFLDDLGGDPDLEDGDEDASIEDDPRGFDPEEDMCLAGDDRVASGPVMGGGGICQDDGPGDTDDAEDGGDTELNGDEGDHSAGLPYWEN